MSVPGRLLEGVALGAFLALMAVVGLLVVYELAGLSIDKEMVIAVFGAAATIAAAGLAAWGISWQIRAGREADENRRAAALHAERIVLADTLSRLSDALDDLKSVMLDTRIEKLSTDLFDEMIAKIRACRPSLAATARVADKREAWALGVLGAELQILCSRLSSNLDARWRAELPIQAIAIRRLIDSFFPFARRQSETAAFIAPAWKYRETHREDQEAFEAMEKDGRVDFADFGSPEKAYDDYCKRIRERLEQPTTERPLT